MVSTGGQIGNSSQVLLGIVLIGLIALADGEFCVPAHRASLPEMARAVSIAMCLRTFSGPLHEVSCE